MFGLFRRRKTPHRNTLPRELRGLAPQTNDSAMPSIAYGRSSKPALTELQIENIMRAAQRWGDDVVTGRQENERLRMNALASLPAGELTHMSYAEYLTNLQRGRLNDALIAFEIRLQDQLTHHPDQQLFVEIKEAAMDWVLWRVRGLSPSVYGSCIRPIYSAHWALLQFLLTLEKQD